MSQYRTALTTLQNDMKSSIDIFSRIIS